MNIKFLLIGTSLSFTPNLLYAQCAVTDCQQLGYTSLKSCAGGLKCPFGEYWACPCDESYKYTCSGSNEQPGTDKCGEKYKSCTCADGYEWKDSKCQTKGVEFGTCTGRAKNCKVADILYRDGTCSADVISGKEPIGVVVYISSDGNCGQAMALHSAKASIAWSTEFIVTGIPQITEYSDLMNGKDVSSCENTKKIIENGNADKYPAAWAAINYAPGVAPETKGKWCLPAGSVLNIMLWRLDIIDQTFRKIGGTVLLENREVLWSSTEYRDNTSVWMLCPLGCANGTNTYASAKTETYDSYLDVSYVARPVIEF